jgi:DNA topoisomerase-2
MSSSNLAQQYQKKTDREHILDNPDTYIGSVEHVDSSMYVFDESAGHIMLRTIEYIPGLYKLFDEGVVNCRDHVIRMIQRSETAAGASNTKLVTHIEVTVTEDGTIEMTNDGNGIDIAKHPEYDIWIPELIFGHLRTSTNYDKEEQKIVGGKNGFGFKLALIWSTYGRVETVDHVRGLKYVQEFRGNLTEIGVPEITKMKTTKPYTKVCFRPDYARLRVGGLTPDMLSLLKKRVYDIAAVTDQSTKKVKVSYNGVQVPVKNFQNYIDLYIGPKEETKRVYETTDERWEYAVAMSETHEFQQVSFVNGIATNKGGKHVDYIVGQITRKLVDYIEKKKKIRVNPASIKEQLILFLRCDVVNPSFDSQTKDYMNTPSNKFGSSCTVSDGFIEKVAKMGVMDLACSLTEAKESKMAAKKTDGTKTKTIRGIANFVDANYSGTERSGECVLVLCEGLSAMSGVISGLTSEDRNTIGVYPLKGKLLNVRGEVAKKIAENKEITDLKKILGLENGKVYASIEDVNRNLRYGKIMVMTDQDLDGSHIKGLCINLFHSEWASLTEIPGFISFMNTPILRATKGPQKLLFYHQGEYDAWKSGATGSGATGSGATGSGATGSGGSNGMKGWTIKYFKGLGTSTSAEFKEYFANKKIVDFTHDAAKSNDAIDMVFNKKRPDDRKTWLENYDKHAFLDTNRPAVSYDEFINNEMIHFSTYDCARSIPNMVDGLKTSLRKILYCAFKRPLTSELKVAQFSGYVSEHSSYHHGEASLNAAIVAMAQNFVGSNNINLLMPNGQFGTRLQGGDDSASERYIFTLLNNLARAIFPDVDDAILTYIDDDGTIVEPEYYVPIIPFALINGISGIGTGFSCNIQPYHPLATVDYLKRKLTGTTEAIDFVPYYEGFKGTVERIGDSKFSIKGTYERQDAEDKVRITELPIGTWTMPYITFLEGLVDGGVDKTGKKIAPTLKDFKSNSTEVAVDITVQLPKGVLAEMTNDVIEKTLKLATTVSTNNMHMFNAECKLHKYESVSEIIDEFYDVRLSTYAKRKANQVKVMEHKLVKLSNRAKYIMGNLNDTIDLRRKSNEAVANLLESKGFDKLDGDYKYLIKMPMDSVTKENVEAILKEKTDTEDALETLKATSCETIWMRELANFESEYAKYKAARDAIQNPPTKSGGGGGSKPVVRKVVKKVATGK